MVLSSSLALVYGFLPTRYYFLTTLILNIKGPTTLMVKSCQFRSFSIDASNYFTYFYTICCYFLLSLNDY